MRENVNIRLEGTSINYCFVPAETREVTPNPHRYC